ncbi:MAG: SUMF1/EgtB/PvdO family nonheme iron enzyme [Flavobacteriales bacterium]|nr:SUMF1/EgtB/PvdO family nonheme iron enzyme [Flavobacteriales bacterium]
MKTIFFLLATSPFFLFGQKPEHKDQYTYKLLADSKEQKALLEDFAYVNGSVFSSVGSGYNTNEVDTNLITIKAAKRVQVQSFFMSKFELSNANYREFVEWTRLNQPQHDFGSPKVVKRYESVSSGLNQAVNSEALYHLNQPVDSARMVFYSYTDAKDKIQSLNISVDTNSWIRDFQTAYNMPMQSMYYWHPAYDEYPVVGVNYNQALAYCDWYTSQLEVNGIKGIEVRLPTEVEWEFAATPYTNLLTARNSRSHQVAYLRSNHGPFIGNFGTQKDQNGIITKSYIDDGAFYTAMVNSYAPNYYGIYNLLGNASEWTSTSLNQIDPFLNEKGVAANVKPITSYSLSKTEIESHLIKHASFYPIRGEKGDDLFTVDVKKIRDAIYQNIKLLTAHKDNKICKAAHGISH